MGLIQNKVTVSQPNSHVVVKNAGGLRGLTGETGPQGPQGVPGQAATVTAGTTTTLPAGSDATVQNVGSTSAAIFNFGIPKGDKGDTGEAGAAATISVGTTTTLEPGEDATVTNSGTSSAAVFDFGIPKGAKGDTGSQGPAGQDGADGYSPTATVTKSGDTATITITDKDGTTTASVSDGTTPTVNDGTLTIQKNGTTVQTFSADQASNVTANITVPTQFSDLSGTVSSSQIEDEAITTGSVSGSGTNITLAGTMDGGAIESVEMKGDTTQQTYSGKNKYEGSPDFSGTWNNESSWTTSSETYNGMVVKQRTAAWQGLSKYIQVNAGKTYTFSCWVKGEADKRVVMYLTGGGSSTAASVSPIQKELSVNQTWTRYSITFTVSSSGMVSPRIENGVETTIPTQICGYQLEESNSMTDFEPYVGGTASPNPDYPQNVNVVTGEQTITISDGGSQSVTKTVNLGKNLFDKDNANTLTGCYVDNDSQIVNTGSSTVSICYIKCEPNTTYTVQKENTGTNNRFALFTTATTPAAGVIALNLVGTNGAEDNHANYSITTPANAKYLGVFFAQPAGLSTPTSPEIMATIQIEKGSVATTYAPYFTPIELCKIGTYQDYIYKSGDDWYLHKDIENVVFNGSEAWSYDAVSSSSPTAFAFLSNTGCVNDPDDNPVVSDHFIARYQSTANSILLSRSFTGRLVIYINKTLANSLSDWTTWLGLHNTTVHYALATPTDTKITNATLISELDSLLSATTYDNNTYITVSGDLASPLEVVAEADSKLAPNSVYGASIKDGAVSVSKIADLKALADALSPYLS